MLFPHIKIDQAKGKLYLVNERQQLSIWNLYSRQLVKQIDLYVDGERTCVHDTQVCYSPDWKKMVFKPGYKGQFQVWDLEKLSMVKTYDFQDDRVQAICFIEEDLLLLKGFKVPFRYLNLSTGSVDVKPIEMPQLLSMIQDRYHGNSPLSFACNILEARVLEGNKNVFLASDFCDFFVYKPVEAKAILIAEGYDFQYDFDISPDGKHLIHTFFEIYCMQGNGRIKTLDKNKLGPSYVSRIRYLPDGERVVVVTKEKSLAIINTNSEKVEKEIKPEYTPLAVDYWTEGNTIVSVDEHDQ